MASRIIHLAITNELMKELDFKDTQRLQYGAVIPDSTQTKQGSFSAHFKITVDEKRTYDLTGFRERYKDKLCSDDLYLGYYLHLIQDLVYRYFVYKKYHWDPRPEGNVGRLHEDYRQINSYVIQKYGLTNSLRPLDFDNEILCSVADFVPDMLIKDLEGDFLPVEKKDIFFFTTDMVDEYIKMAVEYCKKEISALKEGSFYFNENDWAWG